MLLDDRDERPGVMFADMELIGIPHRIVVGERGLKEGKVEYQGRRDSERARRALADAVACFKSQTSGCASLTPLAVLALRACRRRAFAGAQN